MALKASDIKVGDTYEEKVVDDLTRTYQAHVRGFASVPMSI